MLLRYKIESSGNVALLFALLAPLLIGIAGGAVDYARLALTTDRLQQAADAAALAGARQFVIARNQTAVPKSIAETVAANGIEKAKARGATKKVRVNNQETEVSVDINYSFRPTFLVALYKSPLTISVAATAVASGSTNVCIIGLKERGNEVIYLDGAARLSAEGCAVFANSTGTAAIAAGRRAQLTSALACTAGGYTGSTMSFDPVPTTDCPPKEDPLATRTPPDVRHTCDFRRATYDGFEGELEPGVYCGGLEIKGGSEVTLKAGIYVIQNGELIIHNATVKGADVGFYLRGSRTNIEILTPSRVTLHGPLDGPMAGILFWISKDATGPKQLHITSPYVQTLTGTIYLPTGEFRGEIVGGGKIADASAYTAIVAERVTMDKKANLVLNTDYGMTPVPVPAGVMGADGGVRLRE